MLILAAYPTKADASIRMAGVIVGAVNFNIYAHEDGAGMIEIVDWRCFRVSTVSHVVFLQSNVDSENSDSGKQVKYGFAVLPKHKG